MRWLARIVPNLAARRLAGLADELARQVQPLVWECVSQRVDALAPSETVGYVRTHARFVLDRHLAQRGSMVAGILPEQRRRLEMMAAERIVGGVLRAVFVPTSQRAAQAQQLRRAA